MIFQASFLMIAEDIKTGYAIKQEIKETGVMSFRGMGIEGN